MTDKYKLTKKLWNESNSEIIQRSKAKYDRKNPIWSFRITPELLEWLNQERWLDEITEVKERVIAESYNPEIHGPNKNAIPMPKEIRDMLRNALKKVD